MDEAGMNELANIVSYDRTSTGTAIQVFKANQFPGVTGLVANVPGEKQKIATLAMADGVLAGQEKAILQMYMDKSSIAEAQMVPIIEAIAIRNVFPLFT